MTLQEFQTVMTPMILKWKQAYNGDVLHLFHVEFKNYSMDNFKRVVTHLLMNSRVAPMEGDFKKAIMDLRVAPIVQAVSHYAPSSHQSQEDFLYRIRDNIWANNDYVYVRGVSVRKCRSIIKKDSPDHPYVREDSFVRDARLSEIKNHLKANTFQQFMDSEHLKSRKFISGDVMPLSISERIV